jgi:hypothetical protein
VADRAELSPGIPAEPPEEVLEQVAVAALAYRELRARGRELRFTGDHRSGRLVVELRNLHGDVLERLPPSEVLAVAGGSLLGAPLDAAPPRLH